MKFQSLDQIAYVPDHANGALNHPDVELGFIVRIKGDGRTALCRFWRKNEIGKLRTIANGEWTPTSNLVRCESVTTGELERVVKFIEEEVA